MNILICEDQSILLDGLVLSLSKEKSFDIVATLTDAKDILPTLKNKKIDLVLSDIITKNKNNVLEYIEQIKKEFPEMKIVVITGFPDISFMEKAKKVGVNSFIYKNISTNELINVIKNTSIGYSIFPNEEKTKDLILTSLTETELKILRLYCCGKEREDIAKELFMSNSSLKSHITQILQKTGFPSLARVAIYAVSNSLILPDTK